MLFLDFCTAHLKVPFFDVLSQHRMFPSLRQRHEVETVAANVVLQGTDADVVREINCGG